MFGNKWNELLYIYIIYFYATDLIFSWVFTIWSSLHPTNLRSQNNFIARWSLWIFQVSDAQSWKYQDILLENLHCPFFSPFVLDYIVSRILSANFRIIDFMFEFMPLGYWEPMETTYFIFIDTHARFFQNSYNSLSGVFPLI